VINFSILSFVFTFLLTLQSENLFAKATPRCLDRLKNELTTDVSYLKSVLANKKVNKVQVYAKGKIIELLADDLKPPYLHQSYIMEVENGRNPIRLVIVSNLEFERIPVTIGDEVAVCGEFLRVQGGMIHWTHYDPKNKHPHGFTILNSEVYGDDFVGMNF